jgi:hypothetical protein
MKSPRKKQFDFGQLAKDGRPYDFNDIAFGLEAIADGNTWHGMDNEELNAVIKQAAEVLRAHQAWRDKTDE